jgi:hopanoid biosynthesis associated RND transporter like protein HpnN
MHINDPQANATPVRKLRWWIDAVQRRAAWVAGAGLLLALGLGGYTVEHLSVDTDTEHMLSAQLPWRQAEQQMDHLFPDLDPGIVAVIDGDTPEAADSAERRLVEALRTQPQRFPKVFAFETEPYFRRNGLLLLDTGELQKVADSLNQAQPFLGALDRDPSLHGLFALLDRAVTNANAAASFDFTPAFSSIASAVDAAAAGKDDPLSWEALMGGGAGAQSEPLRRFVLITPKLDFTRLFPASTPIAAIRDLQQQLQLDPAHQVRVRLTGTVALEHEELKSAFSGGLRAFTAGMVLVTALLFLALRSLRLVAAAVITLFFGLTVTGTFAAVAIGHLNLISIAFSVLYVGLGIDYSLYLCMQYRELLAAGVAPQEALPRAATDIAGYMAVCAATTSLGFFAFIPTPFTGIAELGLIAGIGMFISLAANLTLLPALIRLMPPDPERLKLRPTGGRLGRMLDWPYTRARAIWIGAIVLAVIAIALVPRAHFDYDPLDLRDPKSESVATFRDLLKDPNVPPLTLSVVTPDADSALAMARKLATLPLVAHALTLADFVPQNQDAKLGILEDLNLSLGPSLMGAAPNPVERPDDADMIAAFHSALPGYIATLAAQPGAASRADAARALLKSLDAFDAAATKADPEAHAALYARLRNGLLGALPAQIESLQLALQAGTVTDKDLPAALLTNWKSADGHYRVEAWPKEVLNSPAAMERFVAQVRTVAPNAVGAPIGFIESGRSVVDAFRQAFLYSFVAITILLLVLMRSVVDMLLVLVPLTLAVLLTVAGSVLLNVPFNFANVIALPLVLGVGVDYGVYFVQRGRAVAAVRVNILRTGAARAVLFGALITIASFGNLMFAAHPGTVSMGILLTLGLTMTLLCALVLLPSLLSWRYGGASKRTDVSRSSRAHPDAPG